jgi:hypothetical protein
MELMHRITISGPRTCRLISLLILLGLVLAACSPPPTAAQPETPAPVVMEATQTPQPVDTATPEPEADRLILVMDQPQPQVENFLYDLAEENQMELEVRSAVQSQDFQVNWKVVVLLPAPGDISALAEAGPDIQFVVSSDVDLPEAANLTVIRSRPEHLAFAAGYIGAVITPDWRIAGLLPGDTALGDRLAEAFQNGGHYYCGLCRTLYAPFVRWPLTSVLPAASDDAAWQAAVTELEPSIIYGMYIDPRVGSGQLVDWLAGKNFILLGGETPPADLLPRWAVTLRPEVLSALNELMPAVISGSGGQVIDAGLKMVDINSRLLSPGRQRMIETMLDDLSSGFIEPFAVP